MLERYLDESIPFAWHHHPEYELTLTLNSTGQRFVGDHVGDYSHGDLVLVGPNLPHTWSSRAKVNEAQPHVALVVWFRQSWIDGFIGGAVELNPIRRLFGRAAAGLSFGTDIGNALRERFESLFATDPATRLITVLGILLDLAERTHARTLSSVALPATGDSRSRIDRVLRHLHQDYVRPVRIGRLAEIAALSESGLHRMFVKHTRTTVSAYVARLRIGEACARLSGTDQPIARIAADVGYDNLANFNRQFRALRGMTPRDYRSSFRT
ncbi:MAG: AraC family transcriptional regulator [Rhizobiaceae bacterium]|nr:AraC family transcriptional regulator [Rhizobiaceae bacterium]